ncbi:MAG: colanic acid biosynthesis glycosyltransferase WcaL, partial [Desulfovibrionaceae bacterium]|nr:colanic acid biosynthesis glycosyltransferase WcaL [Desulfovibrionaceae bacterium]
MPNSPKLACILLWYPLFTQPFIFREIEGLKKLLPTTIYTLYGRNLKHCSSEMKAQAFQVKTHGLKALPQVLLNLVTQPRLFFKLVKELLTFKWPNLEILGENLWALAMGITLAPQFKKDKIEVIYAPWPRGTATAALVIHKLTGIPYVTAVRGDNLQPADPDLALKLKEAALI